MIRSTLHRFVHKPHLLRDTVGILLALAIGVGGLIFVFTIPDPFTSLGPHTPLLTSPDWPGSYASIEIGIGSDWPWRERRKFVTSLVLNADPRYAEIEQTAIWYADRAEAAADWKGLNTDSYNEQPIVARYSGGDKPASMLFCKEKASPDDPRECWYLAYREHWYTELRYWSQHDGDLESLELGQLMARVDQLLMSATEEPCYGVLCTGTGTDIQP